MQVSVTGAPRELVVTDAVTAAPAPARSVTVRVPGVPVPWQRPRARVVGGRAQFFEAAKPRSWKVAAQERMERALLEAGHAAPLEGPLQVVIVAVWALPRTKERKTRPLPRQWRAQRPDADQIAKLVLDAANALLWRDDAQVSRLAVEKWIGAQGEPPFVLIEVWQLEPQQVRA